MVVIVNMAFVKRFKVMNIVYVKIIMEGPSAKLVKTSIQCTSCRKAIQKHCYRCWSSCSSCCRCCLAAALDATNVQVVAKAEAVAEEEVAAAPAVTPAALYSRPIFGVSVRHLLLGHRLCSPAERLNLLLQLLPQCVLPLPYICYSECH